MSEALDASNRRPLRDFITADLKAMFGSSMIEDRLPRLLDADEAVRAIAFGTLAGRWWQELKVMTSGRLIVVTDRRVLMVPNGILTETDPVRAARYPDPESVPLSDIQDVAVHPGRLESKLDLVTEARTIRLTSMRASAVRTVASAVGR